MMDFVTATVFRNEVERQAEIRRLEREDPDQLYRYENWYAVGAVPTLKERFTELFQRLRRQESKVASETEICPPVCESIPSVQR